MPPFDSTAPLADRLFEGRGLAHDPSAGTTHGPDGTRVVHTATEFFQAAHLVLHASQPGVWEKLLQAGGVTAGKHFGHSLDRELARLGEPVLADQPLEVCLALAERHFASQGWGLLASDLSDAPEHGLVVARLRQSPFVEAIGATGRFADALPAGFLQGFLEHISAQPLGCMEIACASDGAPHCTFVITSAERLAPVAPLLGQTSPEDIIAQLKA